MQEYIKPALIMLAFLILALFLIERSCSSPDAKYFELKGQFERYKAEVEEEKQKAEKRELEKESEIKKKEKEISDLKLRIFDLEEERAGYEDKDAERASKISELETEIGQLNESAAIIEKQDLLISEWKERFFKEREDKKNIIKQRDFWARVAFREKAKYQAEKKISENLRARLERETSLRTLAEELNAQNEKRFNRLEFGSTIKTILIVGATVAGGYVIYKELK